ncbi:MAG: hypothetical protein FWH48_04805 [Oscillospiraceae bacterium]|nr:hypothetical protein [Oscillospiraceae bacterium]
MKKVLSAALLLLILTSALASCENDADSEATENPTEQKDNASDMVKATEDYLLTYLTEAEGCDYLKFIYYGEDGNPVPGVLIDFRIDSGNMPNGWDHNNIMEYTDENGEVAIPVKGTGANGLAYDLSDEGWTYNIYRTAGVPGASRAPYNLLFNIKMEDGEFTLTYASTEVFAGPYDKATKTTTIAYGISAQKRRPGPDNAVFYVSSSGGDDGNDGLSPEKPWKTLEKVSGYMFMPGDRIYLKAGDVWNVGDDADIKSLKPNYMGIAKNMGIGLSLIGSSSGVVGENDPGSIILSRYGEGPDPQIKGTALPTTQEEADNGIRQVGIYLPVCNGWNINGIELVDFYVGAYIRGNGAENSGFCMENVNIKNDPSNLYWSNITSAKRSETSLVYAPLGIDAQAINGANFYNIKADNTGVATFFVNCSDIHVQYYEAYDTAWGGLAISGSRNYIFEDFIVDRSCLNYAMYGTAATYCDGSNAVSWNNFETNGEAIWRNGIVSNVQRVDWEPGMSGPDPLESGGSRFCPDGVGIDFEGINRNVTLENIQFINIASEAIMIYRGPSGGEYDHYVNRNITIKDCTFINTGQNPCLFTRATPVFISGSLGAYAHTGTIANNRFDEGEIVGASTEYDFEISGNSRMNPTKTGKPDVKDFSQPSYDMNVDSTLKLEIEAKVPEGFEGGYLSYKWSCSDGSSGVDMKVLDSYYTFKSGQYNGSYTVTVAVSYVYKDSGGIWQISEPVTKSTKVNITGADPELMKNYVENIKFVLQNPDGSPKLDGEIDFRESPNNPNIHEKVGLFQKSADDKGIVIMPTAVGPNTLYDGYSYQVYDPDGGKYKFLFTFTMKDWKISIKNGGGTATVGAFDEMSRTLTVTVRY